VLAAQLHSVIIWHHPSERKSELMRKDTTFAMTADRGTQECTVIQLRLNA